jgi:hypothetical protein
MESIGLRQLGWSLRRMVLLGGGARKHQPKIWLCSNGAALWGAHPELLSEAACALVSMHCRRDLQTSGEHEAVGGDETS